MAALSDDDMRQLLGEFLAETQEGLGTIEGDLVKLEQNPGERGLLESIFRTMHTIKGSAGFLDLRKLESIAHVTEDILTRAMEGQLFLTPASVTVLLEAVDAIRSIVDSLEDGSGEGDEEYAHLKRRLKVINESCGRMTTKMSKRITSQIAADSPLEGQGETWGLFDDDDEPASPAKKETIVTDKFRVAKANEASDQLERAASEAPVAPPPPPPPPAPEPVAAEEENVGGGEVARQISATKVESTIRIDVNLLEKLMNLVGELVLSRNQLLQYSEQIDDPAYLSIVHRASLVTSELQENVMKARMQP
ncbi:MAG: Hpt domain-containing protein, partial [Planctomycetes bacterium]|nr:Hpt domain-containing protein [Planctomycetota bacterium]